MLDFSVTFGITIINIIILTAVLRAVLFKPVTKFMAERTKKVKDSIDLAEKAKADSLQILQQYQEKLKNAGTEADKIIRDARKKAQAESQRIISEGRSEAEIYTATVHSQLELERQAAINRFKLEAAALVMAASARLVQREFSGEDKGMYVNMLLDELASQRGNN